MDTIEKPITTPADHLPNILPIDRSQPERVCEKCGATFQPIMRVYQQSECADCLESYTEQEWVNQREEMIAASKAMTEERWKRICPEFYQVLDMTKLPLPRRTEVALTWQYGPEGLILKGPTGKGKSLTLYAIGKREFMAGRSVRVLNASAAMNLAACYNKGAHAAEEWVKLYRKADLVLFDDTFKGNLTESFQQALAVIVEERSAHKLPMIWTLNDTAKILEERLSADRGPAITRRMRDNCKTINFI